MTVTMIDKTFTYAVVGASNNEEKYGYKVTAFLKEHDFSVVPVNPHEESILGLSVVPSLEDVRAEIDVVVFVVPPKIALQELTTVSNEGIDKVWFQPGSESDEALAFCKEHNIEYVAGACIMTKTS